MSLLNIVIVNWNAENTLKKCLDSVFSSALDKSIYHVYVVDNNSSDQSISLIEGLSPNLTVIKNKINIGFGSACNIVLKNFTAEYFLLLNPDVFVNRESLIQSLDFIENHAEIDILGVKNYNTSGIVAASCARFPSPVRYLNDILGLSKIAPRIFTPGTIMSDWNHQNSRKVDHVIGAFMMLRNSALKRAGYFDEDYFLYMEDVDLAYRINKNGGSCYYNSDISVVHEGGGTTKGIKAISLYYSLQSRIIYCRKHFNRVSANLIIAFSILFEPLIRLIKLCISFNYRDLSPLLSAYLRYFRWLLAGNQKSHKLK
jgi:N-acetylglucosaminyl-diphospho-decaprenol L-rhamnosyltransferase